MEDRLELASGIKLTGDEMRYIALFESVTRATALDCIIDGRNDRVIFVAKQGDMGLAIGKGGKNVGLLRKLLGKPVEVVEYSDSPDQLVKNSLAPARIRSVRMAEKPGRRILIIEVDPKDKALAIGRNGKTIEKTRMLVKRYFQIDHVTVT
ncbi:MAG: NusA-like transcription termination signal-binding factor [Candidatus Bathyarchaeia archaeon]